MARARGPLIAIAMLVGVVGFAFSRTFDNGFVGLDDDVRIYENPHLAPRLSWEGVRWAFSIEANRAYLQPLTWLSLQLDFAAFGPDPRAFHATSLLLHLITAALLLLLLRRMTGALGPSVAAAAIFAAHPLVVEPVAWAVERNTLLAATFGLLALHAYVSYARAPSRARYLLVLCAYAASLLSKAWLFGLPAAMLALDGWPLRRWPSPSDAGWLRNAGKLVLEKLPLLVAGGAWALLSTRLMDGWTAGGISLAATRPLSLRLAHAPVAMARYVGKLLAPVDLAVYYPYPSHVPPWQTGCALALVVGTTALFVAVRRGTPSLLAGWCWFLALIGPTLGMVQAGNWPAIADRFAYVPMIGLIVGVTFAVAPWFVASSARRWAGIAAVATVTLGLSSIAREEIVHWRDGLSLLSHSNAVAPGSGIVEYNLGSELGRQGRFAEAEQLLRSAILHQETPNAHTQLGNVLLLTGRAPEAYAEYDRALALEPRSAEALYNMALILEAQGRFPEARRRYLEFLAVAPSSLEAVKRRVREALAR